LLKGAGGGWCGGAMLVVFAVAVCRYH
jgi:hypothetical protein